MKIRISDRQSDGAIVVIVIAVIVYVCAHASYLVKSEIHDIPYRVSGHDQIVISITVNTNSQGIYWLPRNAKVCDLLQASGIGDLEKFDGKILHGQLFTGNAVFVESDSQIKVREMNNVDKVALNIPININKATLEDLLLIPGIGKKTALQIIQYRELSGNFRTLDDLMKIRGIKEKKVAKLKKYFSASKIL